MNMHKVFGLLLAAGLLFACPALADDASGEERATLLETVTVTATKREGTVKEFPGNLSVMDDAFIETRGVNTLDELARLTPNLYVKNTSSGGSIVCRGISTIDTSLFSPMGLYVDDVAYPIGYMTNQDLFDVERVEVLRGPQATLYGRNSESGVVNIVLREPGNEQRSQVRAELGNYQTARLGLGTSGPIVEDTLFYSLSLQGYRTDGFNENILTGDDDVNGRETVGGRGSLRWTPTDDWDVSLALDGAARDLGISALRYATGANATDRFKVTSNESDKAYEKELGQSLRVKHAWTDMELISITSHRSFDREHHLDADRTAVALGYSDLDNELDSWNQEFRLSSADKGALSWLMGLSARYEAIDAGIDFTHVMPARTSSRSGESEDLGGAVFGQATYELVEGLRLTGGLRLDASRNSGKQTFIPNTGAVSYEDDVDAVEWLPMASLAYDFTPNVTAYATVSRGFLAGGFNFYSATDKESLAYDPEHTLNYEVGLKTNWLDNALSVNATAFYIDISDKQVREEIPGAGLGVWKFTNAAQAHTQGIELEGRYTPIRELQFLAGFGYARSEVDDWNTTVGGTPVDYGGNKIPWAPEYTYNLGVQYNHDSGLFALAELLGTGEQYFDAANELKEDGYETVNLRVGYQFGETDISLWCDNLLDEAYTVKQVVSAGNTLVEDGAPRTFGLSFNWRF